MTASSFYRALSLVLAQEGGWSEDPNDPGGATNLGVTIGTLSLWLGRPASRAELRALTPAMAAPLYRHRYWNAVQGDALPAGLDYALFDFAVNSGAARAIIGLQRALDLADDGHLGPVTLAALEGRDVTGLIRAVCAGRLALLRSLTTWPRFGRGWARRVAEVEAASRAMLAAAPSVVAAPAPLRTCPTCGRPIPA
jgi:lysozyme family protein